MGTINVLRAARAYSERHRRLTMLALFAIAAGLMYALILDSDRLARDRCVRYRAAIANHPEPTQMYLACRRMLPDAFK